ncbi:MAG: hypothetical protein WCK29_02610 [archaeon]
MPNEELYQVNVRVRRGKFNLFSRVMAHFNVPRESLIIENANYDPNQKSYEFVFNIKNRVEKDRILDTLLLSDDILYGCKPIIAR